MDKARDSRTSFLREGESFLLIMCGRPGEAVPVDYYLHRLKDVGYNTEVKSNSRLIDQYYDNNSTLVNRSLIIVKLS